MREDFSYRNEDVFGSLEAKMRQDAADKALRRKLFEDEFPGHILPEYFADPDLQPYAVPELRNSGRFAEGHGGYYEEPSAANLGLTDSTLGETTQVGQIEIYPSDPVDIRLKNLLSNPLAPSTSAPSTSLLSAGPSGYASADAYAGTTLPYTGEGVSELAAAETAATAAESGTSAWGGPATIAGNIALNMIPTRDREKTTTPFGEEGSKSGILKGTGKGALLGATIGSMFPGPGTLIGGLVGGTAGFVGGSQGYFDSTSPPIISMSRIRRGGRGMPQGLLGGGSMYG